MGDLGEVVLVRLPEDYFREISIVPSPQKCSWKQVQRGVTSILTSEEEVDMDRDIGPEEVEEAVKELGPFTAPRPDGVSCGFVLSTLGYVGFDSHTSVWRFLNHGRSLQSINGSTSSHSEKSYHRSSF